MPVTFSLLGPGAGFTGLHCDVAVWHYSSTAAAEPSWPPRPRLLMVHGFRGDHHGLQLIVDALPEFEILVPDLPGFGETPPVRGTCGRSVEHTVELYAGVVAGLARELDFGPEDVLMGHSFGTTIAAAHVAQHRRRWAALVLSAPISSSVFSDRMLPGAAAVDIYYRLGELLPERAGDALLRASAGVGVTNLTMSVEKDPQVVDYVRDQHRRFFSGYSDRSTLLQAYRASSRHTVADYAEDLELPVLLLPGAKDQLSTPAGQRRLRDALPQGRMEVIRGAGHLLHYERPAQVARAMRRFLRELPHLEAAQP